jgi:hypothetical protein
MCENRENFSKWFKDPLTTLYKDINAGFIIVMVSLPLLERYLREKSGDCEALRLTNEFYKELIKIFPGLKDISIAKRFWKVYRHGLLHQATLKTDDGTTTLIAVGVHNEAPEIQHSTNFNGDTFMVSPIKFSKKIISTIENEFKIFEGPNSPIHPPATVDGTKGYSGWGGSKTS